MISYDLIMDAAVRGGRGRCGWKMGWGEGPAVAYYPSWRAACRAARECDWVSATSTEERVRWKLGGNRDHRRRFRQYVAIQVFHEAPTPTTAAFVVSAYSDIPRADIETATWRGPRAPWSGWSKIQPYPLVEAIRFLEEWEEPEEESPMASLHKGRRW